jgi:dolichol-phosphate mannosyltransferase
MAKTFDTLDWESRSGLVGAPKDKINHEVIVIDNGSSDNTWKVISDIAHHDSRYTGIRMSRNFALDAAFTCGFDHANSDLAIIMTSDLQDPPEAIHDFLRKYEEGFDQVLAKITNRGSVPLLRRKLSERFYKIANFMTGGMLPESVSDFRLVSKKCYEVIRSLRESHRFIRGLGSWVGFKTTYIEIERPPRFAGESKWLGTSLVKVIVHGFQSIFAYSTLPLAWVSIFGVLASIFSIIIAYQFVFFLCRTCACCCCYFFPFLFSVFLNIFISNGLKYTFVLLFYFNIYKTTTNKL